ncbi:MAG: pirin family protein [Patescibacteria group bacterium]
MIEKIPAYVRHLSNAGWLRSYFLFSFADYYDPNNMHWGDLRVFNDDTISPHSGFDLHSHSEMEIVTIVLKGAVSHEDSMGNKRKISAGMVQRMSAGTGVRHSEWNNEDEPLHLYQIWVLPGEKGLTPEYEEIAYELEDDALTQLVGEGGLLKIHADAKFFYGKLSAGKKITHDFEADHYGLIYVKSGELKVGEELLEEGDQLRVHDTASILIEAEQDSEFVLIESGFIE